MSREQGKVKLLSDLIKYNCESIINASELLMQYIKDHEHELHYDDKQSLIDNVEEINNMQKKLLEYNKQFLTNHREFVKHPRGENRMKRDMLDFDVGLTEIEVIDMLGNKPDEESKTESLDELLFKDET